MIESDLKDITEVDLKKVKPNSVREEKTIEDSHVFRNGVIEVVDTQLLGG